MFLFIVEKKREKEEKTNKKTYVSVNNNKNKSRSSNKKKTRISKSTTKLIKLPSTTTPSPSTTTLLAMTAYHSPAQLFAQLQQNTSPLQTTEIQNRSSNNQQHQQRLLVFRETGYAFSTPDRIKCVLLCSSTKVPDSRCVYF